MNDASTLEWLLYLITGLVIGHGIGIPLGMLIAAAYCRNDWLWLFRRAK